MDFVTLQARHDGAVLHLTLNRPEVRNAMSLAMVLELRQALAQAEADGTTRVIVLRGAGGHFCAGGDIKDMARARLTLGDNPDAIVDVNQAFGDLCVAYAGTGLAVVAVVQGTVMGGGFGLACVADVTLADDSVVFRLPETSLGLVPAQVGPFLVERLGYAEAKRLAVTGATVDAPTALRLRLVHEVHAEAQALDAALLRVLADILHCAPGALAATKALIAKARLHSPSSLVHEAAETFARAVLGPEGQEGMLAFVHKRAASWMPPK
ncbi:MAG: enoyl-CoA hydratase/isomerase family protein [Rubrivivax sp.]|jgi:isohexenylglutaconyl-CoA hydratase|nr:enoyl-CoA hydratase/isomerase family protein [Rubrivivax sp.]MBK8528733.1 enoyl-CoA hydratase/isomerase family protein [Rubrivivax sp.]